MVENVNPVFFPAPKPCYIAELIAYILELSYLSIFTNCFQHISVYIILQDFLTKSNDEDPRIRSRGKEMNLLVFWLDLYLKWFCFSALCYHTATRLSATVTVRLYHKKVQLSRKYLIFFILLRFLYSETRIPLSLFPKSESFRKNS